MFTILFGWFVSITTSYILDIDNNTDIGDNDRSCVGLGSSKPRRKILKVNRSS